MAEAESPRAGQRTFPDYGPAYDLGLDEFFASSDRSAGRVYQDTCRGLAHCTGVSRPGPVSINVRIREVRKLAVEAADNGLLAPELASGITRVKASRLSVATS